MLISVVIPLYNKAQSIGATLDALSKQTYTDYEVIIVDGYSTDGSLEIVRSHAAVDSRIHIFMQQNRHGVTPARNESVAYAQADYIAFLDADDYWEKDYLQTLVRLIEDYPQAGIYGIAYGTITNNQKTLWHAPETLKHGNVFRGLLPNNPWRTWGCPFWTSATAVSKKAFNNVHGFDNAIIYGEDIDLWWRIMLQYPAVFDATKTLAYYRLDAENRACDHVFPLHIHIPYHIGKYVEARAKNPDFRWFIDRQMLYRLFPYAFEKKYKHEVKDILSQIDFSLQKPTMYWRFKFPYLYKFWTKIHGRSDKTLEDYQGNY